MVDSRDKGARAESDAKKVLKEHTKLNWERVPGSGALDPKHGLKGDLYIPNEQNQFCVEVKHYAEDHLTSKILTGKDPQLLEWWQQTKRQAQQTTRKPLLIFKFDRSKWFCAQEGMPTSSYRSMFIETELYAVYVSLLEDWLKHENPKFTS